MRLKVAVALAASMGFLCGCGGERPIKVSGKITINGEPVEGIKVQFVPVLASGRPASGSTDKDGQFELTAVENNDGAFPGEYKVVLVYAPALETGPGDSTKDVMKKAMDQQTKDARKKPKYIIPADYSTVQKTPVTQKVPTGGPVIIDIK